MSATGLSRWAGVSGILAAIAWTIGDALLVGNHADSQDAPLLFVQYAGQIDTTIAALTVQSSATRLAAGVLIAALTVPLYLLACWHLYAAARPAGKRLAIAAVALVFLGHAYSPLGHAGFYYVASVYQTILRVPVEAHAPLLALAQEFHTVLMIMYIAAVGALVLGLLALIALMASGRTAWPRWMALAVPGAVCVAVLAGNLPWPEPLRSWLDGSGINLAWLLIFGMSTGVLWRDPARSAQPRANT